MSQNPSAENYQKSIERFQSDVKRIMESDGAPSTPCVFFDLDRLDQQIQLWRDEMPGIEPHFAIKACDAIGILKHMHERGISFDAATGGELDLLRRLGIDGSRIVMTHPIRSEEDLNIIREHRPLYLVVQSKEEVIKLAEAGIPSGTYEPVLLVRVALPYSNLNKFGVQCIVPVIGSNGKTTTVFDYRPIKAILQNAVHAAQQIGGRYRGFGLAGHVGTNTTSPSHYQHLFGTFRTLSQELRSRSGIALEYFDIGGGYCDQLHAVEDETDQRTLLKTIYETSQKFRHDMGRPVTIFAEPGRFLVADTAACLTQIKSVSDSFFRAANGAEVFEKHKVIHIDDGVYGNLMAQIQDGRVWRFLTIRKYAPPMPLENGLPAIVWGPTCDSFDRLVTDASFRVSDQLQSGDYFMSECMGAYSIVTATGFNRTQPTNVVTFLRRDGDLILQCFSSMGQLIRTWSISPN